MEITISDGSPYPTKDALEFCLPIDEVQQNVEVGQKGYINMPVEVMKVEDGTIHFRKTGKAQGERFQQQSLQDMEDEIGIAER